MERTLKQRIKDSRIEFEVLNKKKNVITYVTKSRVITQTALKKLLNGRELMYFGVLKESKQLGVTVRK